MHFTIIGQTREEQQAELCKHFGTNFNPPQVVGLSKSQVSEYCNNTYLYTNKLDGEHNFLLIHSDIKGHDSIVECEYYNNKFYLFDILKHDGKDVTKLQLPKRLELLKTVRQHELFMFKVFHKLDKFDVPTLRKLLLNQPEQELIDGTVMKYDGVVLSSTNHQYEKTVHLKLKPRKLITNDYLLKCSNKKREYFLYVQGNKYKDYTMTNSELYEVIPNTNNKRVLFQFHLPYIINNRFTYSMKLSKNHLTYLTDTFKDYDKNIFKQALLGSLDGKIVECCYDSDMQPYPLRIRDDKELPNSFNTCLSNFENIMDPFEIEDDDTYFTLTQQEINEKKVIYEEYRRFGNEARRRALDYIIEKHPIQGAIVLDHGSGRGVNLDILLRNNVKSIIALDPSWNNHIIYYKRLRDIAQQQKKHIPLVYCTDYKSIDMFIGYDVQLFLSNYAIHFMFMNAETMAKLKELLFKFTHRRTDVYFVHYDGQRIFDLLQQGQKKEYRTDKFFIQKKWKMGCVDVNTQQKVLCDYGQQINISVPTINNTGQIEYLVNIEYLTEFLEDRYTLIETIPMSDLVELKGDDMDKAWNMLIQFTHYSKK